ncbi:MAG: hypothetical protein WC347_00985 [Smithellaceae bacterium]|jgi:hypothetical protein
MATVANKIKAAAVGFAVLAIVGFGAAKVLQYRSMKKAWLQATVENSDLAKKMNAAMAKIEADHRLREAEIQSALDDVRESAKITVKDLTDRNEDIQRKANAAIASKKSVQEKLDELKIQFDARGIIVDEWAAKFSLTVADYEKIIAKKDEDLKLYEAGLKKQYDTAFEKWKLEYSENITRSKVSVLTLTVGLTAVYATDGKPYYGLGATFGIDLKRALEKIHIL